MAKNGRYLKMCPSSDLFLDASSYWRGTAGYPDAPNKEEAKAVPLALDADPSQSTDEQAVEVGSRWSLAYDFGDLRLQVFLDC